MIDSLYRWRDRLIARPGFQRWSAAFWPTRGVAARQSRALFDLCAGFVYSQVLAAVVELELLPMLKAGPQSAEALAPRLTLSVEATERLLKAATALKLCAARGKTRDGAQRYGLGMLGAALLGNPGVVAMIRHHKLLYADLADPVGLLRGTRDETALSRFWPYAKGGDLDTVADYSALMSASQSLLVEDVLEAYPFAQHQRMLDIGGGDGTFISHVARRFPKLAFTLFDLPAVAARAEARFAENGLATRAKAMGGDAYRGPLPQGFDLVTLIRVLHDHDDDGVRAILKQVRAALAPGGTLLIAEPMAGAKGAEPVGDAYFGFYLLAMGSGRARTPGELTGFLEEAGFTSITPLKTRRPLMTSAMMARVRIEKL